MHLTEAKYWDERELYSGLIRLHILPHAQEGGFFGLGMIEELARHRYKLSAGTLYPILHVMERKGLLRSYERVEAGKIRRIYQSTASVRKALALAREKVRRLFGEVFQDLPKTKRRKVHSDSTRPR